MKGPRSKRIEQLAIEQLLQEEVKGPVFTDKTRSWSLPFPGGCLPPPMAQVFAPQVSLYEHVEDCAVNQALGVVLIAASQKSVFLTLLTEQTGSACSLTNSCLSTMEATSSVTRTKPELWGRNFLRWFHRHPTEPSPGQGGQGAACYLPACSTQGWGTQCRSTQRCSSDPV